MLHHFSTFEINILKNIDGNIKPIIWLSALTKKDNSICPLPRSLACVPLKPLYFLYQSNKYSDIWCHRLILTCFWTYNTYSDSNSFCQTLHLFDYVFIYSSTDEYESFSVSTIKKYCYEYLIYPITNISILFCCIYSWEWNYSVSNYVHIGRYCQIISRVVD